MTDHRFAYLVLSHDAPRRVEALTARLLALSPRGVVVVHHDRAADAVPWDGAPPDRVHLVERQPLAWGAWSIVAATLRMASFAVNHLEADWLVVLSGEHWPVVDLAAWERATAAAGFDALVPAAPLPARLRFGRSPDPDGNRFLARSALRWTAVPRPRSDLAHRALAGVRKVARRTHPLLKLEYSERNQAWFVGTPRRRGPASGLTLYKGAQWIALDRRAAEVALGADPALAAWFARSHIPDESYLQTVLWNAPGLVVADRRVTFVRPEPTTPTPGWMLLRLQDLPAARASGAAFARKVDALARPDVVDAIDAEVDGEQLGRRAALTDVPAAAVPEPAAHGGAAPVAEERPACGGAPTGSTR